MCRHASGFICMGTGVSANRWAVSAADARITLTHTCISAVRVTPESGRCSARPSPVGQLCSLLSSTDRKSQTNCSPTPSRSSDTCSFDACVAHPCQLSQSESPLIPDTAAVFHRRHKMSHNAKRSQLWWQKCTNHVHEPKTGADTNGHLVNRRKCANICFILHITIHGSLRLLHTAPANFFCLQPSCRTPV